MGTTHYAVDVTNKRALDLEKAYFLIGLIGRTSDMAALLAGVKEYEQAEGPLPESHQDRWACLRDWYRAPVVIVSEHWETCSGGFPAPNWLAYSGTCPECGENHDDWELWEWRGPVEAVRRHRTRPSWLDS